MPPVGDASELCQRCGLCCDGTLFTRTPLLPDEAERLADRALPADGTRAPGLAQPCAALEDTRCTIYEARPTACRRFECLLHGALVEGEVDLDEALAVVAEARARGARGDDDARGYVDHHFGRRRPC